MANGNITIDVEVDSDAIVGRIREAFEDGIDEAAEDLGEDGTEKARLKIVEEGAVWKGELLASFNTKITDQGGTTIVQIENNAEYAKAVDEGVDYYENAPPIHRLLPWVEEHLGHWTPSDYEYAKEVAAYFKKNSNRAIDEYMDLDVWRAYELQKELKVHGLDAVEFMDFAEEWLEHHGSFVVRNNILKELRKNGIDAR